MNLKQIISGEDVMIVDVREPFEYAGGHIEGAVNIPLGTIPRELASLKQSDKTLVLYCRSGNRSGQATAYLKAQGMTAVYNGGSIDEMHQILPSRV